MQTAVIYARYSSDSQTEQSIDGQIRVCEEYAKTHDILILDTYIDRAMTGKNDNRPEFQRMIKDSNRREWNFVLVYKLDRFSRNKYATAVNKKVLKDNGVKLVSASEGIPNTPEGIILESMIEGYAEYYSVELSQKIRRGNNESRRKGNLTGGRIPYGYKNVEKKAVIVEEQAEVVRYIFEQYSIGVYVKDIIKALTEKGILYYGKPFVKNTVYKILKNERYSGIYRYNDEVFDNIYPQLVPQEIYEKVRNKVNVNKYGKRSVEVVYLLRHKLKCGYCGKSIDAECGTSHNGETKYYYKCWGRKHGSGCKKSIIQKEFLESLVLNNIIRELNDQETISKIVNGLLEMQERQIRENSSLNVLLREKRQTETALNNLLSALEQGIVSKTTNKRLHELEERQEMLERQILIEKSKTTVKLSAKEIREFYEAALKLEPQMLINYLIKEIVVYDDKIQIRYNSPIKISPDDNRGFFFYRDTINRAFKVPQRRNLQKITIDLEVYI